MIPTTAPTISSRMITSTTAITPVTEPRSLEDPLCGAVPTPGSLAVVVLSVVEGSVGSEEGGGVVTGLPVEVVVETVLDGHLETDTTLQRQRLQNISHHSVWERNYLTSSDSPQPQVATNNSRRTAMILATNTPLLLVTY